MGSKTTKTKSQETATTTPNVPSYIQQPIQNYYGQIGGLIGADPSTVVPGPTALQQEAYQGASNLPDMAGLLNPANQTIASATTAANGIFPITAQQAALPGAYTPQQVGNTAYGPIATADVAKLPTAANINTSGVDNLAASGYTGSQIRPLMAQFESPYTSQVVDTVMADLGQAQGEDRASYARKGAMNGAFNNARFGIGESSLMDAQNRTRASTRAGLLDAAYKSALQAAIAQAGLTDAAGIASMQSANSLAGQKAGILGDMAIADARAKNDFGLAGFGAQNTANLANASALNNALTQIYTTTNSNNQFNVGQANDVASQIYDTTAKNNQFNVMQSNDMAAANQKAKLDQAQALANIGGQQANIASMVNNGTMDQTKLQGDLGQQQYQQGLLSSPLGYASAVNGLLDPQLAALLTGQTINTSGTSTSKQKGGLLGSILGSLTGLGAAAIGKWG